MQLSLPRWLVKHLLVIFYHLLVLPNTLGPLDLALVRRHWPPLSLLLARHRLLGHPERRDLLHDGRDAGGQHGRGARVHGQAARGSRELGRVAKGVAGAVSAGLHRVGRQSGEAFLGLRLQLFEPRQ